MTTSGDASRAIDEFIHALLQAGVSPSDFATFIKDMTAPDAGDGVAENVPGFEYAQRVSQAFVNALTAHGEEANAAWDKMRRGRFSFGDATQSWTRIVQRYAGVATQALKISPITRPTSIVIEFPQGEPRSSHVPVRLDEFLETDTELGVVQIAGRRADIFDGPPRALGHRAQLLLNRARLAKLRADDTLLYVLYRTGRGPISPLVFLVVRVTRPAKASAR